MNCRLSKKNAFIGLLVFATVLSILLYWSIWTSEPPKNRPSLLDYLNLPSNSSVENFNAVGNNVTLKRKLFVKFYSDYQGRLADIPHRNFKRKGFVEYGPPIVTFGPPEINAKNQTVKHILLWTAFFGIKQWVPEEICAEKLKGKSCAVSTDRNDLPRSDLVIIHPRDLQSLPARHLPSQRWMYFIQESPFATGINVPDYTSVFNWTMTYREDSDFYMPYYKASPLKKPLSAGQYADLLHSIISKKNKLLAVAISNCDQSYTNRLQVIKELKKYVSVDFYGACGDLTCVLSDTKCKGIFQTYKFYMAFENSNCREYITEKVHFPLHSYNAVPIVMGGSHPDEYERLLPPNSYIHFQGFSSVKKLAEYLIFLDENPEYYEKYHGWRKGYTGGGGDSWCDVCRALHNNTAPSSVYTDFLGWYSEDVCLPHWKLIRSLHMILHLLIFIAILLSVFGFCLWWNRRAPNTD